MILTPEKLSALRAEFPGAELVFDESGGLIAVAPLSTEPRLADGAILTGAIDTAPRDGTWVEFFFPGTEDRPGIWLPVHFEPMYGGYGEWIGPYSDGYDMSISVIGEPSHWRPLSAPPNTERGGLAIGRLSTMRGYRAAHQHTACGHISDHPIFLGKVGDVCCERCGQVGGEWRSVIIKDVFPLGFEIKDDKPKAGPYLHKNPTAEQLMQFAGDGVTDNSAALRHRQLFGKA